MQTACKADSMRCGVHQPAPPPPPTKKKKKTSPEGSDPNHFHMVFKLKGAMIYSQFSKTT